MAQDLVTKIRLDDKQFKSIIDKVKSEVGNTETVFKASSGNIKRELKAIQGELSQMLLNGVAPASEAFVSLSHRAGAIKDAIGDAGQIIGQFANDTRGLTAALDVAGTGIGIFQTVAGSMALFGVESEEAQKTLTKLAGAMSVLNGITQLQNTFMDQSSGTYRAYHALLRLVGIEQTNLTTTVSANTTAQATNTTTQVAGTTALTANTTVKQANAVATTETTTATAANTVATEGATVATGGLTVAQGAATVASKALRVALSAIGIGILISLVAALYQKFDDLTDRFKTAEGASSKMAQAWNKLKVVAVGIGNVIWEHMIYPLKMFAGIVRDIINGDWDKIVSNAVQSFKGGHDVIGNYKYAANKEKGKQAEEKKDSEDKAAIKKINDNLEAENAKKGSSIDREIVASRDRLKHLKKDSEEYRKEYNKLEDLKRQKREQAAQQSKKASQAAQRAKEQAARKAETARKKAQAEAQKAAEEAKRKAEKIADDQKTLKQTIETETTNNNKGSRKVEEEQLKNAYGSDKSNVINTQGALDNQLKLINDYYTKIEGFRQADLADEIAAVNKKYAALAEKAHDNKELLTQLEEQKQAAISNLQAEYANKYTELLDQRAKDEKEASDKLLNPLIDKARQLGQELGRSLDLKGLDFSALTKLTEELQKSVDGMKELQKVKDSLGSFENSGITRMLEDAKALQQILGSKMASDGEKIGASMVFMSQAIQQLGQDSAAAKAGLVLQAIGQIILGFAQASAQDSKLGVIGWVAAIAAGTAVMISTISQLQSFSQGGIFQGSKTVGDHNLARVNSGEMILTKTQQGNLFRILDNNTAGLGGGVGVSSVRVKGSDIYLALSNYSKVQSKTGRRVL
jgi:protein tolA|nr:MAG TPA: Nuclear pore complex protein [Caudoviricetes sp.]